MRLLIAEDDFKLLKSLKYIFERAQYLVDGVTDGMDAFEYAQTGEYDGLIFDIMMPGMDGIEVLKRLRAQGVSTPALFLTAKTEVYQRVEGLDAGADDYIPKPFSTQELLARVRAMLRRKDRYTPEQAEMNGVIGLIEDELDRDEELLRKQQEDSEQSEEEEQDEGLSEGSEAPVSEESPEVGYEDEPEEGPAVDDFEDEQESEEEQDEGLSEGSKAPVSQDSQEEGYEDEPEENPAVDDSEDSSEQEDDEEYDEDCEEIEDSDFPEEAEQDTPASGYIEGELGAAVEVAPNFDNGQDESPGFPEPDEEEENEDYGMNMVM